MDSDAETVRRLFGVALRHLRRQADMSLRELGQHTRYDYSRISRVERGEHLIDPQMVPALDRVLKTGGLLTALRSLADDKATAPGRKAAPEATPHVDDGDTVVMELRTADGSAVQVSVSRREFARLVAGGVAGALMPLDSAPDRPHPTTGPVAMPRRIDPQILGYLRNVLDQHF